MDVRHVRHWDDRTEARARSAAPSPQHAPPTPTPPQPHVAQADLKPDVARACDYLRSGPHKGGYRLKPEFRSVSSAAPEPGDGIE